MVPPSHLGVFDSSLILTSCVQLVARHCKSNLCAFLISPSSFHAYCYLPGSGTHYLLPYSKNLTDLSTFKSLSTLTFPTKSSQVLNCNSDLELPKNPNHRQNYVQSLTLTFKTLYKILTTSLSNFLAHYFFPRVLTVG